MPSPAASATSPASGPTSRPGPASTTGPSAEGASLEGVSTTAPSAGGSEPEAPQPIANKRHPMGHHATPRHNSAIVDERTTDSQPQTRVNGFRTAPPARLLRATSASYR